ncbi:MAG TPA: hypothetical protein VJ645_02825 [Gaiellaceae bacterium]|jgi:hypothetical protein|nr:hypothetical protein [Gaiellaceae bacterium]
MAERDELGDITDQGPWEREDEHADDEPGARRRPRTAELVGA